MKWRIYLIRVSLGNGQNPLSAGHVELVRAPVLACILSERTIERQIWRKVYEVVPAILHFSRAVVVELKFTRLQAYGHVAGWIKLELFSILKSLL